MGHITFTMDNAMVIPTLHELERAIVKLRRSVSDMKPGERQQIAELRLSGLNRSVRAIKEAVQREGGDLCSILCLEPREASEKETEPPPFPKPGVTRMAGRRS